MSILLVNISDKASFLMYLQFWPGPEVDVITGIECNQIDSTRTKDSTQFTRTKMLHSSYRVGLSISR